MYISYIFRYVEFYVVYMYIYIYIQIYINIYIYRDICKLYIYIFLIIYKQTLLQSDPQIPLSAGEIFEGLRKAHWTQLSAIQHLAGLTCEIHLEK